MAEQRKYHEEMAAGGGEQLRPADQAQGMHAPTDEARLRAEAAELQSAIEAGDFDIMAFLTEYQKAQSVAADAESRALRVQADFDNYRRRTRREAEEAGKRGARELICNILPVIDNLERAIALMPDDSGKDGVLMIYRQLMDALACAGLSEIAALGADFDPNFHQAVAEDAAGPKGKVTLVLQKGYLFDDKLLRPSMVHVGK
ncbi:MAG: nucleotide exchange factor GrpE [Clostridia bacterium]|nr:nucleotide exchange factor GrpE [Clostridia bacterium]